ncbi:septation protein SepH [Actinomadura sediminis]|uniref:Septation protein SepH n=1 Tax=Actinomadura sediminis TaxID=1038904 RepID=A0ABW3ESC9_9ACTN
MQELRLVAVSEDGTYLVLATAGRGTRFTLPVDDRLRAAVRGHFSRLGQFEIEVESPLRPKEIQARIRSGETAEEIAESAGIPVERVRWFEGPVLQEREYMAQQAQRVTVRRPGESTPGPPLGETVEERLGRGGVDLEDVEWDAWKCDDGTWRVRLSFFDNGRPHAAEWAFDPRRRNVSPLDEIAARLTAGDWDDDDLSDTVTPLVPRRPAMKVVTDGRDVGREMREVGPRDFGRGLPAEPEQPLERASEPPLRAAEPREYIVERGRIVDPRPAFPPGQPARPRDAGADREPIRPFDDPEPAAPSAAARPAGERPSEAPWLRAPEPSLEELEELEERTAPADAEEPEPADAAPAETAESTEAAARPAGPAEEPAAEGQPQERAAAEDETAPEPADEADGASGDARPDAADDAAEAPADEPAEPAPARPEGDADTDAGPADEPEKHREAAAGPPAEEPESARESGTADDTGTAGDTGPAAPVAEEPAEPAPGPEQGDEPAAREQASDEPAPREEDRREQDRREEDRREQTREQTRPAAPQRAPRREPARPAPKKKPATRPTMPAAQDKPVTGPPAAAAADASPAPQRPARARRKSKGKRASVPSWDEIMFGARRPE